MRLDVWVERHMPGMSRSRIQALIRSGHVSAKGLSLKAHRKVTPELEVRVEIPAATPTELIAEPIPLDIIHEDGDIIVVNKPAGLVVHPAAGHTSGTLVNALLCHCRDLAGIGGELRPGIVHRLDRDTSGVMVVAKNESAMLALARQFRTREVEKEYLALVHGRLRPPSGTMDRAIGRSPRNRKKMSTRVSVGRQAITHYETLEILTDVSWVRLRIETGRTHQIRVHLTDRGCPVVGDTTYGRRRTALPATRQMLHAASLSLVHPRTAQRMAFTAPLPADMAAVIAAARSA